MPSAASSTAPSPSSAQRPTPEAPWPVRVVSQKIASWVERLGTVWIEGQVVQLNPRPGAGMAFAVLRDTEADFSLPLVLFAPVLAGLERPLEEGARVICQAKPTFWSKRGSLQLQVDEIRPVGLGDLLARIELLKRTLAAEGLFDADRKLALPFLPGCIGLICGRESKAEHDVVVNVQARWPAAQFEIRPVAVQGPHCVPEVTAALAELDADPRVDVIVIARGGGAVEDLLPFSSELLVRAVADAHTPVVSAIGHETDAPLLDLVADLRASTPTDAAKRIVPDRRAELDGVARARAAMRTAIARRVAAERHLLASIRSRPALAHPHSLIDQRKAEVTRLAERTRTVIGGRIEREDAAVRGLAGQLRALSPQATLERGYAVVRRVVDGAIVRAADQVPARAHLHIRLADGSLTAQRLADRPNQARTDSARAGAEPTA